MHQGLQLLGHKAVVDEEIFFDTELRIAAFQIAGTIILDAMPQHEILRPRWGADGVGLHEPNLCSARLSVVGGDRLRATAKRRRSSKVMGIGDRHPGTETKLLQRGRHVLVNDQPLSVLILPDHCPAKIAHLDFARFGGHLFGDCSGTPGPVAFGVNGRVIVYWNFALLYRRPRFLRLPGIHPSCCI